MVTLQRGVDIRFLAMDSDGAGTVVVHPERLEELS
jgi:hypothetical protein